MHKVLAIGCMMFATAGQAASVPSGHALHLQDQFAETLQDGTHIFRQRFVMPAIREEGLKFTDIIADFEYLCAHSAVPQINAENLKIDEIVISLSDRETEFGVSNPDATQFFEVFALKNDICIWEAFE